MECDVCGSERQELVRVEVAAFASAPAITTLVCPRCLGYDMLRALVRDSFGFSARGLKPVA